MTYRLFLDDERFPPDDRSDWRIARSVEEAKLIIEYEGWPELISFDHDLGNPATNPTGYDFAKWIVEQDLDFGVVPDDIIFEVHSQNPVGAQNIRMLLRNYFFEKQKRNSLTANSNVC